MPTRQGKKTPPKTEESASPAIPAYKRGREFKVILPPDVSERIERRAREEGKPQSRIIVDDLSRIPFLESQAQFGKLVKAMETVLARYGSRIVTADLETQLLRAIDRLLEAKPGEVQARLDGLRVLRAAMASRERAGLIGDGDMKWGVAGTPMQKFDDLLPPAPDETDG
jgi:hypothetical protein